MSLYLLILNSWSSCRSPSTSTPVWRFVSPREYAISRRRSMGLLLLLLLVRRLEALLEAFLGRLGGFGRLGGNPGFQALEPFLHLLEERGFSGLSGRWLCRRGGLLRWVSPGRGMEGALGALHEQKKQHGNSEPAGGHRPPHD